MDDPNAEPHITAQDLRSALARPHRPAGQRTTLLGEQPARGWDWDPELSAADRAELDELRATVTAQRDELDRIRRRLDTAHAGEQDLRRALSDLLAAKPWQRRGFAATARKLL
jgi:uncharacterized protein involved in exopolysaccharide biosynthesis